MKDELMEKMKLSDIHSKEKNYETVLHESRLAVQNYVRTGYKSKQLGLIIDCEDKFHENYKKLLETELHKEIVWEKQKLPADIQQSESLKEITDKLQHLVQETVQKILTEFAYYNNMNMIYEFLDNEICKRKEDEYFKNILQTYPVLKKLVKFVEGKRRVFLKDVTQQLKISKRQLEEVINNAKELFIIDEKKEETQITLSPQGMKISIYIAQNTPPLTAHKLDQCVYQNCFEIMDKLENSLLLSRKLEVRIESISPSVEHSIKSKYNSTFSHMCIYRDEGYNLLNHYVSRIEEKEEEEYGKKVRFKINNKSKEW